MPPKFDLCLLQDETGSFDNDFDEIQAAMPGVKTALDASGADYATCVLGFRDFARDGWGSAGDWVYRRIINVAPGGANLVAGAALITHDGGLDGPEAQLEALHYLATPAHPAIDSNGDGDTTDANDTAAGLQPTWRAGSQRIVLLATDASCHVTGDAGGWPGDAGTTSPAVTGGILSAAGITLIGLTPGGAGTNACVDTLASATGGTVQATTATSATIGQAILAGVAAVQINVSMASDCVAPITTTFSPTSRTATVGTVVDFVETISVAATAPGGTYTCKDWVVITLPDGTKIKMGDDPRTTADETIYETKTIRVPEGFLTGGGRLSTGNGASAKDVSGSGNVGFLADFSLVGEWNAQLDTTVAAANGHFHGDTFTSLQFSNDGGAGPNPPPANANVARFTVVGSLNGTPGYRMNVTIADRGEPGKDNDELQVILFSPANVLIYSTAGNFPDNKIDSGNYQIHSGLKS